MSPLRSLLEGLDLDELDGVQPQTPRVTDQVTDPRLTLSLEEVDAMEEREDLEAAWAELEGCDRCEDEHHHHSHHHHHER